MEIANELSRFKKDIETFGDARKQADANQSRVFQELMELNAMWEGPAHATFEAGYQSDRVMMEETIAFLNRFKEELDIALTEYQKCENSVAETIASIKV